MNENTESAIQLSRQEAKAAVLADNRGLKFDNLESMWRFCVAMVASRRLKDIDTPETALLILQAGLELGLSPVWSLQNVMAVNGRVAVWGDALLGLIQSHPDCEDVIETLSDDGTAATCEVHRRGRMPIKRTFTVDDARKAGLWDKPGPWKNYPKRMLQMRARSWACRDSFADALRGLGVVEELRDVTPEKTVKVIERPKLTLPDEDELQPQETELVAAGEERDEEGYKF